ncbi:MAG: DUF6691 family protein [Chloroflexota bacterium]|jgi:rhodanese-related sulfurtransferase/uncharacterized membrane protein YedE/YeeE
MAPFPLPLADILGHWGQYVVYLLIGIGFGFALEMSGFANAPKLAAQFYFKDMTVLKVMFGAIVTAMVLVFLASAVGLLDYYMVYVNPTFLWPGIVGGLIMGVGFILGGFCPGTSLVSAAVGKIDGIIFVLGVLFGIFAFGETVQYFESFWYSSFMGRFTIPEWLGLPIGIVVVGVVLMALFMFWGSEQLERIFGGRDLSKEPKWRYGAAGVLVSGALLVAFIGQPTTADRWSRMEATEGPRLAERQVQIHPAELLQTMHDDTLKLTILDVRSEADYNQFHIRDAVHAPMSALPAMLDDLHETPDNEVIVLVGNDEATATEAWKFLRAESVRNLYLLEGGVNNWVRTFGDEEFLAASSRQGAAEDELAFTFATALGSKQVMASPASGLVRQFDFLPKIVLELKRGPGGGGCG